MTKHLDILKYVLLVLWKASYTAEINEKICMLPTIHVNRFHENEIKNMETRMSPVLSINFDVNWSDNPNFGK